MSLLVRPNIISSKHVISEAHIVWCIKSRIRLFIYLSPIVTFPNYCQNMPYNAEN